MTSPILQRRTALLGGALLLTAAACSSKESSTAGSEGSSSEATRDVETNDGTVAVPSDPKRIVVLDNAVLAFLDLGGKPVGVSAFDDATLSDLPQEQQDAYHAATAVSTSSGENDLEKIASLKPDVIITQTGDDTWESTRDELNAIAPSVFVNQESDWEFRVVAFATAGNLLDTMNEQKKTYEGLLTSIKNDYAEILKTKKIAEVYRMASSESGQFALNQSLSAEVARDEGILKFKEPTPMSFEQIGDLAKYDLLVYNVRSDGQPTTGIEPLLETNAWKELPAVKGGHAQGVYAPWGRAYGFMVQYLQDLEKALSTLKTR